MYNIHAAVLANAIVQEDPAVVYMALREVADLVYGNIQQYPTDPDAPEWRRKITTLQKILNAYEESLRRNK